MSDSSEHIVTAGIAFAGVVVKSCCLPARKQQQASH